MGSKFAQNRIRTADRLDPPGERQHITPMAVGVKQGVKARTASRGQRVLELRQPILPDRRYRVCSNQHCAIRKAAAEFHRNYHIESAPRGAECGTCGASST